MSTASHKHPSPIPASNGERGVLSRLGVPALAALLLFAAGGDARAQQGPLSGMPRISAAPDDEDPKQISSREEMLRNIAIKRRALAYKENIERAKENAALGAELRQTYGRVKNLGSAEQKKLGRMEKLARAIREEAGGDDDKEGLVDVPAGFDASFAQLEKLSVELQNKVEKTPRHVVSTSVINTANKLLGLIRHLRASFK